VVGCDGELETRRVNMLRARPIVKKVTGIRDRTQMTSRETFLITASSEDRKMTRSLSNYKVVMMLMYALVVRLPRRRSQLAIAR
jgi:hypothetical protein